MDQTPKARADPGEYEDQRYAEQADRDQLNYWEATRGVNNK